MKKRIILSLLAVFFGSFLVFNNDVHAVSDDDIMKKWIFTQYYSCIRDGQIVTPLKQKTSGKVANDVFNGAGTMAMPSYSFGNASPTSVNCKTLFNGSGFNYGVTTKYTNNGNTNWGNFDASAAFLEGLGYVLENEEEEKFKITATKTETIRRNGEIISGPSVVGQPESVTIIVTSTNDGGKYYEISGSVRNFFSKIKIEFREDTDGDRNDEIGVVANPSEWLLGEEVASESPEVWVNLNRDTAKFYSDLKNSLANITWLMRTTTQSGNMGTLRVTDTAYTFRVEEDGSGIVTAGMNADYIYAKDQNSYTVSSTAIKNMSGMTIEGLRLTNNEIYRLYSYYLDKSLTVGTANRLTCNPTNNNGLTRIKLKNADGQFKECFANYTDKNIDTIYVYTQSMANQRGRQPYPIIERITIRDVVKWFNEVNTSTLTDVPAITAINSDPTNGADPNSSGASGGSGANCKTTAKALGWILCPILDFLGGASTDLYENFIKSNLEIQPTLFTGRGEATHQAWRTFQGIANVLFIILFLIVIFSQLTGVGIDNYGIKRILPRLILTAVLMNLSYYICEACIDLSNIAGNGVQALFDSVEVSVPSSMTIEGQSVSFMSGAMTSVSIIGGLLGAAAIYANPAILLSLLVSAIGLLVSVFFLFILLAARQAAVVAMVVISPIAIACYMLPNTKKAFDRWLKIGEGLLLVYPICGLLVGGGDYVSRLLLQTASGNFFLVLTAMIVGIVPIFFIPTMLRSSFSAMGNLGARISGFGDRLGRGVTGGIRKTEGYKAAQARGYERKTRIQAGYDKNYNPTTIGRMKSRFARSGVGRALGYQGLQSARVAAANKTRERDIQANAELADVERKYDKSRRPGERDEDVFERLLTEARDSGNQDSMFSVIEQMRRSNMQQSKIAEATGRVLGGEQLGNMSAGQRKNFLEEFGKRYGGDFLKKDFAQANWARRGGIGVNNTNTALGDWITESGTDADGNVIHNIEVDDLKDEDVAALSSDNLSKLIEERKISQAQAQRVWASNGSMDDTNRLILGNYGVNGSNMTKKEAQKVLNAVADRRKALRDAGMSEADIQDTIYGNAGKGIPGESFGGLTARQIAAYTRRAAQDTVIRDVRIQNAQDGSENQSDDLYVNHRDKTTPPETFDGGSGI